MLHLNITDFTQIGQLSGLAAFSLKIQTPAHLIVSSWEETLQPMSTMLLASNLSRLDLLLVQPQEEGMLVLLDQLFAAAAWPNLTRLEFPFPHSSLRDFLQRHPNLKTINSTPLLQQGVCSRVSGCCDSDSSSSTWCQNIFASAGITGDGGQRETLFNNMAVLLANTEDVWNDGHVCRFGTARAVHLHDVYILSASKTVSRNTP